MTSFSEIEAAPVDKEISSFLSDYKDTPMKVHDEGLEDEDSNQKAGISFDNKGENATLSGEILSGTLFLTLIESFMPILLGIINDKFDNKKVDIKKLGLTAKQKKELIPICDEVVKKFEISANPVYLLVGSLVGIYGINYMSLRNQDD